MEEEKLWMVSIVSAGQVREGKYDCHTLDEENTYRPAPIVEHQDTSAQPSQNCFGSNPLTMVSIPSRHPEGEG